MRGVLPDEPGTPDVLESYPQLPGCLLGENSEGDASLATDDRVAANVPLQRGIAVGRQNVRRREIVLAWRIGVGSGACGYCR